MDVRCSNCHTPYEVNLPQGQSRGEVACPSCGIFNSIESPGGAGASLLDTKCSTCGGAMAATPGDAVPICSSCRGESPNLGGGGQGDSWMVRKESGKIYGPFTTEVIQQWLADKKLEAIDEIARSGEQWMGFFEHPEFKGRFSSSAQRKAKARMEAKAAEPKGPGFFARVDWALFRQRVMAVTFAAAALFAAYYSTTHRLLILPEELVNRVQTELSGAITQVKPEERAPLNVVKDEALLIIDDLKTQHPSSDISSTALRIQALSLLNKDSFTLMDNARSLAEQAVISNPNDPHALAALVEVWSPHLANGDTALLQRTLRISDRSYQLSPTSSDVLRARARYLIASGRAEEGAGLALQAVTQFPEDALSHLALGIAQRSMKPPETAKAIASLEKAATLNPRLPRVYSELGKANEALGHFSDAAKAYRKRLRLNPGDSETIYSLGAIQETIGAPQEALTYYNQAIQTSRGAHLESTLRAGILELQAVGNPRRARDRFMSVINNPHFKELKEETQRLAYNQLASSHRFLGETLQAQTQADKALALEPSDPAAHFNLGMAALSQRRFEEAFGALRMAADNEGEARNLARLRYFQGMASILQSKPRVALGELVGAVDLDPNFLEAQLQLAALYLRQNQVGEALAVMDRVAHLDPKYQRRTYFHASPYVSNRFKLDDIAAPFKRIAQERYYVADVWANYAIALYHLGWTKLAVQNLAKALQADPNNARTHFYRGLIQLDNERYSGAVLSFKAATESDPRAGMYWIYLGDAYTRAGALKEAERAFERAMQFEVNAPSLKLGIGRLLYRQGEREAAHTALMDALKAEPAFSAASQELYQYGL